MTKTTFEINNVGELWKRLSFPFERYEASSFGNCRNYKSKKKLTLQKFEGYISFSLRKGKTGKHYTIKAHKLIATTFHKNTYIKGYQVNHKNKVRDDNRLENLEWMTVGDNNRHRSLNEKDNRKICKDRGSPKSVIQMTLNEEYIATFASAHDAARILNLDQGNISYCCLGKRKKHGSFKFKFKEENIIIENEIWKQLSLNNKIIEVSNLGRVKSLYNRISYGQTTDSGYKTVKFNKVLYKVHRLVAKAFIINPDPINKKFVNHIDENRSNNAVINLEWSTRSENAQHSLYKIEHPIESINIKTGEILQFKSCSEAGRILGISKGSICKSAKKNSDGKKCGFKFRYLESK